MNKTSTGTVTLTRPNTFTGTTTVTAGVLAYGVTNVLGTNGVTVNAGTLSLGTWTDSVGTVTLNGGTISATGAASHQHRSFAMQSGSVNAILAGSGIVLNKTTTGTVVLSAANTYSGATNISRGDLGVRQRGGHRRYLPGIAVTNAGTVLAVTTGSGGGGGWSAGELGTFLGGGTTFAAGTALGVDTAGGDFSYAGDLGGAATAKGLTTMGSHTLTLGGVNTYTGPTTVGVGTLAIGINDAIGPVPR